MNNNENSITYKPLEPFFNKWGFDHDLIRREGDIAIYHKAAVKGAIHPVPFDAGFEVVVITRHDGYEMAGVKFEPAEQYPGNEAWGTRGWTYRTFSDARKRFNSLLGKTVEVEQPDIEVDADETVTTGETAPRGRGRPKLNKPELNLTIPVVAFTARELSEANSVTYIEAATFIKENLDSKIKFSHTGRAEGATRGKPSNFYVKI